LLCDADASYATFDAWQSAAALPDQTKGAAGRTKVGYLHFMRFGQSCFRLGMLDVQLMIRLDQPTMEQTE